MSASRTQAHEPRRLPHRRSKLALVRSSQSIAKSCEPDTRARRLGGLCSYRYHQLTLSTTPIVVCIDAHQSLNKYITIGHVVIRSRSDFDSVTVAAPCACFS